MKKFLCLTLAIVFIVSASMMVSAAHEMTVELVPSKTSVEPGDTLILTLKISQNAEFCDGTFFLGYDPAKVTFSTCSIKFGSGVYNNQVELSRVLFNTASFAAATTDVIAEISFVVNNEATGSLTFTIDTEDGIANPDGDVIYEKTESTEGYTAIDAVVKVDAFKTNTIATVGPTSTEFNVAITDCPDSGIIYVGIYDGKVLKACGMKKFTSAVMAETITVENVTGDTFKVFIWDEVGTPLLETPEVKPL